MKNSFTGYADRLSTILKDYDWEPVSVLAGAMARIWERGDQLFLCGNGGSAVAASHYITDWNKMIYTHTKLKFNGICLSDNVGLITAYSNDLSYSEVFSEQVKNLLHEGDLLITLSGSGNSENVIRATMVANDMKVNTLAICGYDGGGLKQVSNNAVWIRSYDMQLCEDAQTVFGHMVMKSLCGADLFVSN